MSTWSAWRERFGRQAIPVAMDWLIVGLGNPGPRYAGTRHNIGRDVVEVLAARLEVPLAAAKFQARFGAGRIAAAKFGLAVPISYMNESGRAVGDLVRFHKLDPSRLVLVYDDLDLPLGRLRIRPDGGAGGHNGVASVIDRLGTQAFPRLRIGIGRPPAGWDAADYVLARFGTEERASLPVLCEQAADALTEIVRDGLQAAMNRWNS